MVNSLSLNMANLFFASRVATSPLINHNRHVKFRIFI